ncbi:MAG: hypothetical protein IKS66_06450, partial [Oscillospiraceae bacterium]|nr:hypothetical protein [Oscillospiraceae bacterium]
PACPDSPLRAALFPAPSWFRPPLFYLWNQSALFAQMPSEGLIAIDLIICHRQYHKKETKSIAISKQISVSVRFLFPKPNKNKTKTEMLTQKPKSVRKSIRASDDFETPGRRLQFSFFSQQSLAISPRRAYNKFSRRFASAGNMSASFRARRKDRCQYEASENLRDLR